MGSLSTRPKALSDPSMVVVHMHSVSGLGMKELWWGFVLRYLEHICQWLDLVVVGQAVSTSAMGKLLHANRQFQKRERVFFQDLTFLYLTPSVFPESLWFSKKSTALQASLQVLLSNHLSVTPCSLSLLAPFCPHCFSLSRFLSLSTMVRSHGERQLAGCRLAAMATGTLPLPQVSLATSSLAL